MDFKPFGEGPLSLIPRSDCFSKTFSLRITTTVQLNNQIQIINEYIEESNNFTSRDNLNAHYFLHDMDSCSDRCKNAVFFWQQHGPSETVLIQH